MAETTDNSNYMRINKKIIFAQRIRNSIIYSISSLFSELKFTYIDPPILHEQILGKEDEIYLPLYSNRYSLNSSNALFLSAYSSIFGNVYSITPTFRDEKDPFNHLVEFRLFEAEVLHMTYSELPSFIEMVVMRVLKDLKDNEYIRSNLSFLKRINSLLSQFPLKKFKYDEYIQLLDNHKLLMPLEEPIFILDFPIKLATWTAIPRNNGTSNSLNLLLPGDFGELCEGCERSNNASYLKFKMKCAGITNLEWYIDAVSRITAPRVGFGMGIERLIRWIADLSDISEATLFPRTK